MYPYMYINTYIYVLNICTLIYIYTYTYYVCEYVTLILIRSHSIAHVTKQAFSPYFSSWYMFIYFFFFLYNIHSFGVAAALRVGFFGHGTAVLLDSKEDEAERKDHFQCPNLFFFIFVSIFFLRARHCIAPPLFLSTER